MKKNSRPFLIEFDSIGDSEVGYISVAEYEEQVPFEIKRVYWTYDTPNDVVRGHHSHKALQQVVVAVFGQIELILENKKGEKEQFLLTTPSEGVYIPPGYWRTIKFSQNGTLLCLASEKYSKADYIRDYEEFKNSEK